ncbi:hypothetical protein HN51_055064, partial [Arachis hypogaea]
YQQAFFLVVLVTFKKKNTHTHTHTHTHIYIYYYFRIYIDCLHISIFFYYDGI